MLAKHRTLINTLFLLLMEFKYKYDLSEFVMGKHLDNKYRVFCKLVVTIVILAHEQI